MRKPAAFDERANDDEMVASFSAGESSGLERVYTAYRTPLYSIARTILRDEDDAQDCVHDALLRIWQHPGSYRTERGSLRSYLLASVRNEALTRMRNAARHSRIEQRVAQDQPPAYELNVKDPIERTRLRRALAELPSEQRIPLELAYFGQLTHVQVAERLDAPLGTIKSRIALALRKLQSAMSDIEAGQR